jgi:basic amino acid/polyamine antiporter, APA family
VLRRSQPDLPRVFRCPAPFVIGTLAVAGCLYLLASLPAHTLTRFALWNVVGVLFYFAYGRRRSLANDKIAAGQG